MSPHYVSKHRVVCYSLSDQIFHFCLIRLSKDIIFTHCFDVIHPIWADPYPFLHLMLIIISDEFDYHYCYVQIK